MKDISKEEYALYDLIYRIRVAAGDRTGRLMQDELIKKITALRRDSEDLHRLINASEAEQELENLEDLSDPT